MLVSVVVCMLALLPTRWLVPWTADVGLILSVPLTPLRHGAGNMVSWVRSPSVQDAPTAETVDQLIAERNAFRGRWHAARLEKEKLERQLAQLQAAQQWGLGQEWTPRLAQVVRHNPGRSGGVLSLNIGTRQGVRAGTVAVVDGDRLVGRIAPGLSALSSVLVPLGVGDDPAQHDVQALVLSPTNEDPQQGSYSGQPIRLTPTAKSNEFAGVLERGRGVTPGDIVRLGSDPAWHTTAWGMLIGTVDRVEDIPEQPLRERIVVRRDVQPNRLYSVTLKIEKEAGVRASVSEEQAP